MTKPYSFSYSKLALFRRCLQSFQWKYVEKFFPPSGIGQLRGTCGHAALAVWHTEHDAQLAMDAAWDTWTSHGHLETNADWQLLEDALNRYFGWSAREDVGLQMLVNEQEFNIPYTLPDGTAVVFNGFIDGIVEVNGMTYLMEHKFLKQVDNGTKDLDHQSSLYLLACTHMGYKVQGVMYNQIRMGTKVAEKEPVLRRMVTRNLAGLEHIEAEMLAQVQAMYIFEKGGGLVYRNPTKDCSWDCSFYSACLSLQDDGQMPTELLKRLVETRSENAEEKTNE